MRTRNPSPLRRAAASSALAVAFALALGASLSACGDDSAEPAAETQTNNTTTSGPTCACTEGACDPGVCTLRIVLGNGCAARWGTANVFFENVDASASPVGTVSEDAEFDLCDPIPVGQPFQFIVESEDTRLISGSASGETFTCPDAKPFVWTIDQDCD